MKKFIYLITGVAMASAMASCVDTEKPVFQAPTEFTVNTPALQNEYLPTTSNIDDKSTFMLYASQPDYGFAAQASYSAQVSLSPDFVDATETREANYRELPNQEVSSGAMKLRTYDLAVAMTDLLGFEDEDQYKAYLANGGKTVMPVYLRGICEIPGVPESRIISSNVVSYNNVQLNYAVKVAGFIYICGDVNGFKEPKPDNAKFYEDYRLIEPELGIGSKLYAGTFLMPDTESAHAGAEGVNYTTQWRFFTELSGWADGSKMVGSKEDDFYVDDITKLFKNDQYSADATYGKGNWGVLLDKPTEMTLVVSLQVSKKPKVWFRYGKWDVQVGLDANGMNEPVFSAAAE